MAYPVTILIDDQTTPFKIGMNVNATIETSRLEDVVVIENRAVQLDRETGQAFVEKLMPNDEVQRTEIVLGERGLDVTQVLSGLEADDKVVIRDRSRREQLRQAIGGGD